MEQNNFNTNQENNQQNSAAKKSKKKYTHLDSTQRQIIERFAKLLGQKHEGIKVTRSYIASILGVHVSTISRELKRNSYKHIHPSKGITICEYVFDHAEALVRGRKVRSAHRQDNKLANDSVELKNLKIIIEKAKVSPEEAIAVYEDKFNCKFPVCLKTVYKYIHSKHLKIKSKYFRFLDFSKPKKGPKNAKRPQKGDNISLRPAEIENREEFGHWEGDTVYGQKLTSKMCLLTLVERKTRLLVSVKIPDRSANSVVSGMNKIEQMVGLEDFKKMFKTITFDNGTEFSDIEGIENSSIQSDTQRVKTYFANAYHSWERGTNENTNGMIRFYYPKGTNFEEVTDKEYQDVVNKINFCPREANGHLSAYKALVNIGDEFKKILEKLGIQSPFGYLDKHLLPLG